MEELIPYISPKPFCLFIFRIVALAPPLAILELECHPPQLPSPRAYAQEDLSGNGTKESILQQGSREQRSGRQPRRRRRSSCRRRSMARPIRQRRRIKLVAWKKSVMKEADIQVLVDADLL